MPVVYNIPRVYQYINTHNTAYWFVYPRAPDNVGGAGPVRFRVAEGPWTFGGANDPFTNGNTDVWTALIRNRALDRDILAILTEQNAEERTDDDFTLVLHDYLHEGTEPRTAAGVDRDVMCRATHLVYDHADNYTAHVVYVNPAIRTSDAPGPMHVEQLWIDG